MNEKIPLMESSGACVRVSLFINRKKCGRIRCRNRAFTESAGETGREIDIIQKYAAGIEGK